MQYNSHLVDHFALFLQNHNGEAWNTMFAELETIYGQHKDNCIEITKRSIFVTSQLAARYFREFSGHTESISNTYLSREPLIAIAAQQIAAECLNEINLQDVLSVVGNFCKSQ